ncbi:hypothetical protein D3C80_1561100 [compost metagenome]
MRVQRQVISVQVDIITQQRFQPVALHTTHRRRFVFPEIAVMHHNGVRLMCHCRIQQRLTGGHAGDDTLHVRSPFHLQAIRPVILKRGGVQFCVDQLFQIEVTHRVLSSIQNVCRSPCSIRIYFTPRLLPCSNCCLMVARTSSPCFKLGLIWLITTGKSFSEPSPPLY